MPSLVSSSSSAPPAQRARGELVDLGGRGAAKGARRGRPGEDQPAGTVDSSVVSSSADRRASSSLAGIDPRGHDVGRLEAGAQRVVGPVRPPRARAPASPTASSQRAWLISRRPASSAAAARPVGLADQIERAREALDRARRTGRSLGPAQRERAPRRGARARAALRAPAAAGAWPSRGRRRRGRACPPRAAPPPHADRCRPGRRAGAAPRRSRDAPSAINMHAARRCASARSNSGRSASIGDAHDRMDEGQARLAAEHAGPHQRVGQLDGALDRAGPPAARRGAARRRHRAPRSRARARAPPPPAGAGARAPRRTATPAPARGRRRRCRPPAPPRASPAPPPAPRGGAGCRRWPRGRPARRAARRRAAGVSRRPRVTASALSGSGRRTVVAEWARSSSSSGSGSGGWPARHGHHRRDRQLLDPLGEVDEEAQRRRIAPVGVVDAQHERALLGEVRAQPVEAVQRGREALRDRRALQHERCGQPGRPREVALPLGVVEAADGFSNSCRATPNGRSCSRSRPHALSTRRLGPPRAPPPRRAAATCRAPWAASTRTMQPRPASELRSATSRASAPRLAPARHLSGRKAADLPVTRPINSRTPPAQTSRAVQNCADLT